MPTFMSRLFRPFTTSTRMGLHGDGAAASSSFPEGSQKVTVAAGCFWGVEHIYRKHFNGKGLLDAKVGYIGGDTKSPSYRSVCSGSTGHAEALQVIFDPSQVSYRQLVEFFYRMHDPTTKNRQGGDTGSQYRSAIFYHDADQEREAKEITKQASEQWYKGRVTTEVVHWCEAWLTTNVYAYIAAGEWYDAETYHQLYLDKNPGGYECPSQ
ncbi:MAG: Peptide-methionine (S)-S-oxide reductase [Piccolia ochrophora]|nr:MAG: Peptide-methionine (S)-S-oxide reductase [Piccolia ochrophora]